MDGTGRRVPNGVAVSELDTASLESRAGSRLGPALVLFANLLFENGQHSPVTRDAGHRGRPYPLLRPAALSSDCRVCLALAALRFCFLSASVATPPVHWRSQRPRPSFGCGCGCWPPMPPLAFGCRVFRAPATLPFYLPATCALAVAFGADYRFRPRAVVICEHEIVPERHPWSQCDATCS